MNQLNVTMEKNVVSFIVCPSLPYIYNFIDYELCSQDISQYEEVITGETTGKQLKELLIKYVLIGHAERRKYLKENNEVLIRKIKMANKNDIKVIYCVTEEESDLDSAKRKIKEYIDSVNLYLKDDAIIAYEPIWAIGNDLELDYNYINEIISYIKELTNKEVIYGGSVNEKNIDNFINNPQIEGFLISNSGLDLDKLSQIINKMS